MTPVILFKVDDNEYGVLPADDSTITKSMPCTITILTQEASRFIEPAFPCGVPLAISRPQGMLRRD